jgi:type VI secretion system protein VasG
VELDGRWNAECAMVDELLALRAKLRAGIRPVEGTGSKLKPRRRSLQR